MFSLHLKIPDKSDLNFFLKLSLKIVGIISAQFIPIQRNFIDKCNNNEAKIVCNIFKEFCIKTSENFILYCICANTLKYSGLVGLCTVN